MWPLLSPFAALLILAGITSGCGQPAGEPVASSVAAAATTCTGRYTARQPAPSTDGMVLVRGGTFLQGAQPANPEEGPPRETTVGSFWIDRTEVTNADFARFVLATGYVTLSERPLDPKMYPALSGDQLNPSAIVFVSGQGKRTSMGDWWRVVQGADWRHPDGPSSSIAGKEHHPVVQIAYDDALAYARWLGRDLPTEAEWEFAARGGLDNAPYSWGDEPLDLRKPQGNVWQGVFPVHDEGTDGYKEMSAPVGCFTPNGYGLFDMAGNVWEWTKDLYRPGLAPADTLDPAGPVAGDLRIAGGPDELRRVIKGGSFLCADSYCFRYRPPAREAGPTDTGSNHVGFRTVLRVER